MLFFFLLIQSKQKASLHSPDQLSSGSNTLQGAVYVPVQVRSEKSVGVIKEVGGCTAVCQQCFQRISQQKSNVSTGRILKSTDIIVIVICAFI